MSRQLFEEARKVLTQEAAVKLDPVGQEDKDVDNDGDADKTDSYLKKRRGAISAAIAKSNNESTLSDEDLAKLQAILGEMKKKEEMEDEEEDEEEDDEKEMKKEKMAEGAPDLLKQEMPLVRHIERKLAQHGYEKGTSEYDQMFKHSMAMYRKFGNVDAIKQGVAEGSKPTKKEYLKKLDQNRKDIEDIRKQGTYGAPGSLKNVDWVKKQGVAEGAIEDAEAAKKKMQIPAAARKAQGGNWKVTQQDLDKMPAATRTTSQGLAAYAKRIGMGEESKPVDEAKLNPAGKAAVRDVAKKIGAKTLSQTKAIVALAKMDPKKVKEEAEKEDFELIEKLNFEVPQNPSYQDYVKAALTIAECKSFSELSEEDQQYIMSEMEAAFKANNIDFIIESEALADMNDTVQRLRKAGHKIEDMGRDFKGNPFYVYVDKGSGMRRKVLYKGGQKVTQNMGRAQPEKEEDNQ